jgi:predicted phage-related endonuclease
MKIINVQQGSLEWLALRAQHWCASDAAAMLGVSALVTRSELLHAMHTGIGREFSDYVQRTVLDKGHELEAIARPRAEEIIGDDLYPVTATAGRYLASFDGITLDGSTAWEHKRLNAELRAILASGGATGADLPEMYRVQMEHQCIVSGAGRALFMASDDSESLACWYTPDPALRARIVAGWVQFERDLQEYNAPTAKPKPVGRTPETLPALRIEARGMVTASNLGEFKEHALTVLGAINRTLVTDDDFADAERTVKWCADVESRLDAARANVLGQMADVDAVCRTIDDVAAETRRIRLDLDKLVKAEKDNRKTAIVVAAAQSVRDHYAAINATLGEYAIDVPAGIQSAVGLAIKGLRTLTSITDAAQTCAANHKLEASARAERVRACVAVINEFWDHSHLIADRVLLAHSKAPDDLRAVLGQRVAEHKRREDERAERQREQIRAEELARIERERVAADAQAKREQAALRAAEEAAANTSDIQCAPVAAPRPAAPEPAVPVSAPSASGFTYTPAPRAVMIKLGEINAAIAPLSITADGLARLGFNPVATDKAAKLYDAPDFPRICEALVALLRRASVAKAA